MAGAHGGGFRRRPRHRLRHRKRGGERRLLRRDRAGGGAGAAGAGRPRWLRGRRGRRLALWLQHGVPLRRPWRRAVRRAATAICVAGGPRLRGPGRAGRRPPSAGRRGARRASGRRRRAHVRPAARLCADRQPATPVAARHDAAARFRAQDRHRSGLQPLQIAALARSSAPAGRQRPGRGRGAAGPLRAGARHSALCRLSLEDQRKSA